MTKDAAIKDAAPTQGADARPVAACKCRRLGDWNGFSHHSLCDMQTVATQPVQADAAPSDPCLDKRAQVGNTRFGVGVKWSTVIGAAQRHHDYMNTPEKESERIEKAKAFLDVLTSAGQSAEPSADAQAVLTRDQWIEVAHGLPVIPEGEYRTEVLTARYRGGNWVRAATFFGGTSASDESRSRFYIESAEEDELGYQRLCVNIIHPTHWQALPGDPEA